jgi:hypothetical protein
VHFRRQGARSANERSAQLHGRWALNSPAADPITRCRFLLPVQPSCFDWRGVKGEVPTEPVWAGHGTRGQLASQSLPKREARLPRVCRLMARSLVCRALNDTLPPLL